MVFINIIANWKRNEACYYKIEVDQTTYILLLLHHDILPDWYSPLTLGKMLNLIVRNWLHLWLLVLVTVSIIDISCYARLVLGHCSLHLIMSNLRAIILILDWLMGGRHLPPN